MNNSTPDSAELSQNSVTLTKVSFNVFRNTSQGPLINTISTRARIFRRKNFF